MGALQIWLLTAGALMLVLGLWMKNKQWGEVESSMPMAVAVEDMGADEAVNLPPSQMSMNGIHPVELEDIPVAPRRSAPARDIRNGAVMGPVVAAPSDMVPAQKGLGGCTFDEWIGQKAKSLKLEALNRPYRILPPGALVTMDFVEDRINVETDENDTVIRVTCG